MNSVDKVKVLIVDDSALVRKILTDALQTYADIEVVATAHDGQFVLDKIQKYQPDVITLDVEMRNISGLEILPQIKKNYDIPVIMVSAHTERGAHSTVKALEFGAVDFITKPQASGMINLDEIIESLAQKIISVGKTRIRKKKQTSIKTYPTKPILRSNVSLMPKRTHRISADMIAIGASTGGTEAIREVLTALPATLPGIVIVQHMPSGFTKAFANRLNSLSQIEVKEAEDGDEIKPGTALIAPGSHHVEVFRMSGRLKVRLLETPPVNRHRPSVDVLFYSTVKTVGSRAVGIILTGMGADGARGLKELKDHGVFTIAQDEDSCVVFGMPKEAIKLGGASTVLPLDQIGPFVNRSVETTASIQRFATTIV